jgi:uncharacterized sporulation protein YeaH/YhbH (DUF444 family)
LRSWLNRNAASETGGERTAIDTKLSQLALKPSAKPESLLKVEPIRLKFAQNRLTRKFRRVKLESTRLKYSQREPKDQQHIQSK